MSPISTALHSICCFCGPKLSRRYLLIVNVIIGVVGFILLGVGSFSLEVGGETNGMLGRFCIEQCKTEKCASVACSPSGCDCSAGVSTISTEFVTAPAAGMAAVGFLSMIVAVVGCMAAARTHPIWLAVYMIFLVILIILQFSFGIAAAALGEVPMHMENFFRAHYQDLDWKMVDMALPSACYASETVNAAGGLNHHPGCSWDNVCVDPACCGVGDVCSDECMNPDKCITSVITDIGAPVAVGALLTLFLQFIAIFWANNVRRETKAGGVFDQGGLRI